MPRSSKWSPEEKLRIVLAGIKGERTIAQICRDHKISETIFYKWRDRFMEAAKEAFKPRVSKNSDRVLRARISELERIIGRLTVENEILKKTEEMIKGNGEG